MSDTDGVADLVPAGILSHISVQDLETLKFYGVFGEFGPGEVVVEQGTQQTCLYVVISGLLEVVITGQSKDVKLGEISTGDCIGEVSIFEPGVASATVRVLETSVLWSLDVQNLQTYFEQLPVAGGQLMLGIAQLLSKRLRQANQTILSNQITPVHLSVRSGLLREPIRPGDVAEGKEASSGIFGGLLGSKKDSTAKPKIPTRIKR
ncbi:MAG: cyclic nucleotide-binding domain-containing protein [Blastochloris sp.]|nr:cyclic nucleotide-binding domain-containing protein [Blastochloris sp.]